MKKLFSILLVLALCVSIFAAASAAVTLNFTEKKGMYATGLGNKTKTSSTGTAGSVDIATNPDGHSMYYQIHKANGGEASKYVNTTGTGEKPLPYKNDGNGNSLGRYNYSYRLRVAHRSQCTCSSGSATISVNDFTP